MSFQDEVAAEVERIKNEKKLHLGDQHKDGQMAGAAACYLMNRLRIQNEHLSSAIKDLRKLLWPWASVYWEPRTHREDLVHTAALLQFEAERLDRIATSPPEGK